MAKSNVITKQQLRTHRRVCNAAINASVRGLPSEITPFVRAFLYAKDEEQRSPYRDEIIKRAYSRIERYRAIIVERCHVFENLAIGEDGEYSVEPYPMEAVDGRVRSIAAKMFEDHDVDGFIERLEAFIRKEVNDGRFEET